MTGYWKEDIERGHKTGPYRTSIEAVQQYNKNYENPYGLDDYKTSGFTKVSGKILGKPKSMLSPHNIKNLKAIDYPYTRINHHQPQSKKIIKFKLKPETKEFVLKHIMNANDIFKYLLDKRPEKLNEYKTYKPRCWHMDTQDKENKWGLQHMLENDAYSSSVNIRDHELTSNIIMMYLWKEELILSPWNGEQQNHEE